MKKILITGGGGYIGSTMSSFFVDKGFHVTCIDRFFFGKKPIENLIDDNNFVMKVKDIRDIDSLDMLGIDIVIDLAGISNDPACDLDKELTDKINHLGTVNVAKAAKKAGVEKYIMASSCSIYGASDGSPLTENSIAYPVSLYAKSKIDSELAIKKLQTDNFSVTFLRLSTVFGLSKRMRFDLIINIMTKYAITKKQILVLGGGKQWRPLVHVKDVARAFYTIIKAKQKLVNGEAFNVGSNKQNYQVFQVANTIKNTVPEPIEIIMVPDDPDKRNYNVNFDKINNVLGYQTKYDIEYGIMEIYNAISLGEIDCEDIKTITVEYYKYLIKADSLLNQIKINGKLF